jgi:hypothetical protein
MIFKPEYEVFTAPGGKEALEILQTSPIDVVTLDLRMPGMPGIIPALWSSGEYWSMTTSSSAMATNVPSRPRLGLEARHPGRFT